MTSSQLFGGIEAGGTKFNCIVASGPDHIVQEARIPTTTPEETLGKTIEFFQPFVAARQIDSIGIACFGPLDLDPASPTYGFITATPKPHWSNTDVRGTVQRALDVRTAITTDVNGAALGEFQWGASQGCDPSLYLTVGTGIGGGYLVDGKPLTGLLALEMGHIRIPHDFARDPFPGNCPFHGDCFEGLANGPAIQKRFGARGESIPDDDPFWDVEADYIAAALANYILTLSPKKIVLGGGVMAREYLFAKVRHKVQDLLNGYVSHAAILTDIDHYIVPPALGIRSGSLGAVALAKMT
jgi:fructokinase